MFSINDEHATDDHAFDFRTAGAPDDTEGWKEGRADTEPDLSRKFEDHENEAVNTEGTSNGFLLASW